MSANIDAVLARLDEMNNGEINYEVYRELHDLVSAIEDDVQAPIEVFPGTLDALSIRARTTSPDAATEEFESLIYPDYEGLTAAVFERSHEPAFSDDSNGLQEARAFAESLVEMYIDQQGLKQLKAKRDAALAALERVRAEADAYAEQPDVMEPCGAVAQALRTALDGAPESEVKP